MDARVLVVDDDENMLDIVVELLRMKGFHVDAAPGPHRALELIEQHGPDYLLMVTDVMMPGMTGLELAAIVRSRPNPMPIVFMTGTLNIQFEPDDLLLQKPFKRVELNHLIQRALEQAA